MIIVAASLIGIGVVVACGADLRRLSLVEVRRLWLVWAAIGLQVVVLTYLGRFVHGAVGNAVHLGTYALAGMFVVSNRRVPGMVAMGTGAAMNLTAIIANGGVMPASAAAWETAGFGAKTGFNNSVPVDDPTLLFLGDVFALPAGWPLANVFSAGDVILVVGVTWMVHRVGTPRRSSIPDGYVMVRRTDEHRDALIGARERLGELIAAIERQADDARTLTRSKSMVVDGDSTEWNDVIDTLVSRTSGGGSPDAHTDAHTYTEPVPNATPTCSLPTPRPRLFST